MSQDTTGQRWRVADIFRATIKDVIIGAVGVAILALPIFSLGIVVNDFDGLFGRDLPLPHWVALPVILAWAVAAGIYIAACNFGILPRLVIAVMLIVAGAALWLALFLFGPVLVAALLGAELSL